MIIAFLKDLSYYLIILSLEFVVLLGVMLQAFNPNTWETEAGRRLRPAWLIKQVLGEPRLHRETFLWKTYKKRIEER